MLSYILQIHIYIYFIIYILQLFSNGHIVAMPHIGGVLPDGPSHRPLHSVPLPPSCQVTSVELPSCSNLCLTLDPAPVSPVTRGVL